MAKSIYQCCVNCCGTFEIPANHIYKKFCNLSCSTGYKNKITKENNIKKYLLNTAHCVNCNINLDYKCRKNKFCSTTCAAVYNNNKKDWSTIKTGPKKGTLPKNYYPKTKIKQCIICNKFHPRQGNTCSSDCLSIHISNSIRGKVGGNRDCNLPGKDCNGKDFFFDSTWEIILAKSLSENNIFWVRPERFILTDGRSYTPDFYIPEYNIYIDPKAKRKNYYRKSLLKIQKFSLETGNKCLVITEKNFLTWGHVQTMLLLNVVWS